MKPNVFIINLKGDVEKRKYMQSLCSNVGLEVNFIEAIDGKLLSSDFIDTIYSKNKASENIGRELCRSEIGCALSHKEIYKKIVDEKINQALILEDDVDFGVDLLTVLKGVNQYTKVWDLILLGSHSGSSRQIDTRSSYWGTKIIADNFKLVRPCEKAYGTYGYLISLVGAKKILNKVDPILKPIDHYTGDNELLNLYIIKPSPIKIHDDFSDNFNSMEERENLHKKITVSSMNKKYSLKKKVAKPLGIYHLLFSIKLYLRAFIRRIKPLRKYK